jgi:hypothetical protein
VLLVEHELLPFRSTRVHPWFLVGFVLLELWFSVWCFVGSCLSFFFLFRWTNDRHCFNKNIILFKCLLHPAS